MREREMAEAIAEMARDERNAVILLRSALRQIEATADLLRLVLGEDAEEREVPRAIETMGQADATLVAD